MKFQLCLFKDGPFATNKHFFRIEGGAGVFTIRDFSHFKVFHESFNVFDNEFQEFSLILRCIYSQFCLNLVEPSHHASIFAAPFPNSPFKNFAS